MSKPITGVAVMMLQSDGKLNLADPVAISIPELAQLKTPSGRPANLTITQILTHTSGLGEASGLAATPNDYARFGQMLLNRGMFGGQRFLSKGAFEVETRNSRRVG